MHTPAYHYTILDIGSSVIHFKTAFCKIYTINRQIFEIKNEIFYVICKYFCKFQFKIYKLQFVTY